MSLGPEGVIMYIDLLKQELNDRINDKQEQLGSRKDWSSIGEPARLAGQIQGLDEALIMVADASAKFTRSEDEVFDFNE